MEKNLIRTWSPKEEDSEAVHCYGNGRMLVYAMGPNLSKIIGPPYTMPSFAHIIISEKNGQELYCETHKEKGSNIWIHEIQGKGNVVFTDYIMPDQNVSCREYTASEEFYLDLKEEPGNSKYIYRDFEFGSRKMDCVLIKIPMGTIFFTSLAVEQETWLVVCVEGGRIEEDGNITLCGNGRIILSTGSLPDAVQQMEDMLQTNSEDAIRCVRNYWKEFLSGINDLGARLPADVVPETLRRKVSDACESVSMLIKCQQSIDGGVQAGYHYPLGYVRDMAGGMRGMLALGMKEEAKKVLTFWYDRFCLFGNMRNADGMGNKGGRLYFPNDEVEVPAYLITSAFWYADMTGDIAIIEELYPMLKWAFEVQLPQLGGGMTSFSGDETYIAGGTLPGIHEFDGSAESTMLFIEGGEKFLDWCSENHKLSEDLICQYREIVYDARERYKENFCIDGLLYANNPARLNYVKKPRFIQGYCQVHTRFNKYPIIAWLMYDEDSNSFCCMDCYKKHHPNTQDAKKRHLLSSVSLATFYHESTLFDRKELEKIFSPYLSLFEEKGFVPSNAEGTRSLGYDYGLFLYAASSLKHSKRIEALEATMEVLDETGAWVEYYDNKRPYNCRCRAWESGINMDAIRKLAESFE